MEDFLVAGSADSPEDALALMRATTIASFGEAVRELARANFRFCHVHGRAVPMEDGVPLLMGPPHPERCVCPAEASSADKKTIARSGPETASPDSRTLL